MDLFAKNIVLAFSAFVVAFLISSITIFIVIRLSHHFKLFDAPDERKIHSRNISRLGGIGIFLGFFISVGISPFIVGLWMEYPFVVYAKILPKLLFILPVLLMFIVGLFDDFYQVKARWKLLLQIIAAVIVLIAGARISHFTIPFIWKTFELGIWSWPITFLWIIGITNAINLIDGMDGLSGIISTIAFSVYGLVFLLNNHFILAVISLVLVGTLLGYLMFNFPPAKIFMGDSGSLVLGFLLAVLPLVAGPDTGSFMYMPITLLLIPIGDVISAIIRRYRNRVPFFTPDMEHVHHKLLALGLGERFILRVVSATMLISAIPLVASAVFPFHKVGVYIFIVWVVICSGFIVLHFIYRHKQESLPGISIEES